VLALALRFWAAWQSPLFASAAEQSRCRGFLALLVEATAFFFGVADETALCASFFPATGACTDLLPETL
jgi:hypothetical protein